VPFARVIYRATPFLAVRQFYHRLFAWMVRHRVVRHEVDGSLYQLDLGETIDLNLFLGEFERDIHEAVAELCRPGMIVADIGANVGAHTLLFARAVSPGGRVYAFEPTEYAFAKLQRNVALNPWTDVHAERVALAEAAHPAERIDFRASWPVFGPRRDAPCVVSFDTLDAWAARHGVTRLDLIKIDVDGYEWNVLQGGRAMLATRPVLLLEVTGNHFRDERNPVRFVMDAGYSIENARTRRRYAAPEEILPELEHGVESINLICRPAGGDAR
jgi:FkbM family methyltransferase